MPKFRTGANSFEDLLVPYGGEDIRQVGQRVERTITETLQGLDDDKTVLMVSHGAAMWGLIVTLGIQFPAGLGFSNCAICQFDYDDKLVLKELILPTKDYQTINFE